MWCIFCTPYCKITTDSLLLYLVKTFKFEAFPNGMYIAVYCVCCVYAKFSVGNK